MQDEMDFILDQYGEEIYNYLGSKDLAASFYNDSEFYADKITPRDKPLVSKSGFNILFYQDYSFDDVTINDFNYCEIAGLKFIKIVTPFLRNESYDFIISKHDEIKQIISHLDRKRDEARESDINFPIIGLDFTELRKNTIDFLLDEDFREYCREKNIKLKRGVVLEGKPGTGKTLSIKWLKHEASKNNINVTNFKNIDDFLKGSDEYYNGKKNIFIFEDFDAALTDRKETGETPNQILAMILNTLDGIDKIENVVSIFTTNVINIFDDAFLRPGRIDKVFTYQLPSTEEMFEFFKAYIPEEKEYFEDMVHLIDTIDGDIPYATLKGICDEIIIWKYNQNTINFEEIEKIIKDKIRRKNTPEDKRKYIL